MSKTVGATTTPYTFDRLELGGLGQIAADGSGENVFGPAGLQGRSSTAGVAQHAHGDGLGSLRLVIDGARNWVGNTTSFSQYHPPCGPRKDQ